MRMTLSFSGKTLADVQKSKQLVCKFLKPISLNLSTEKTYIGHSMSHEPGTSGSIGLDFLSYNFKNITCFKHRGVKSIRRIKQNFKLITKPSSYAVINHKAAISQVLIDFKRAPIGRVMECLSSCIQV